TFLRRLYLDLAGQLPPPEVVRGFLDDRAADKRARLVEALLASPRYAEHFADYWQRVLLSRNTRAGVVDEMALRDWLERERARNRHWNTLAHALIAASGRNSDGGPRNPAQRARALSMQQKLDDALGAPSPSPAAGPPLNGAVNYVLRWLQEPEDLAGSY